ncbi:hypothetical protein [Modestobacter roseus]|uniref:Uncharacterized protein n=1 Tax=Modestobacter roseus TaxID=1181884 RepID=A0A562IVJ0_9ACTN|nr:hypothetical protein [Modestobacter roseus]MQA35430.1 hypothetical protein [Modestobacter roseus]TWH75019.1 hypothetical protein JD78_03569 [Modestobacter roseus]
MSQSHPPIPEPQPADGPPEDDPRTESILLPPSQRQTEQPPPVPGPPTGPAPVWTPPADPPDSSQPAGTEPAAPQDVSADHPTGRVDVVPGFPAPSDEDRAPGGSSAAGPQTMVGAPPVPGPSTAPRPTPGPSATDGTGQRSHRSGDGGRDRTLLAALGLGALGLVLLQLGLALDFGIESVWQVTPTWAAFATVAALLALLPAANRLAGHRLDERTAWRTGAGGAVALAAFWVLVALPLVASDRGFLLTAALAAAAGAVWLAPGRPR